MKDFKDISYLKNGNPKQVKAYQLLIGHGIMHRLIDYHPILAGTIPLEIDIEGSDLDILCCWTSREDFIGSLHHHFSDRSNFKIRKTFINQEETVIANFFIDNFEIEIFGQSIPSDQQTAFRHMLIEYQILMEKNEDFKKDVIALKRKGCKTEPAFAALLGLAGNPYEAILAYEIGKSR